MKIISHRGYWLTPEEKNSEVAFQRSFSMGFGTETDVRDFGEKLLISHDMPRGNEITFSAMLAVAQGLSPQLTLALNIKADGLAMMIRDEISAYPELDCFVFDMSIPDMLSYLILGVPVFTRMSEVEQKPAWFERAAGVWLDSFESTWFDNDVIARLLATGKRVCIVSSELHKRDHIPLWSQLKPLVGQEGLILCTDLPEEATRFFKINEGN